MGSDLNKYGEIAEDESGQNCGHDVRPEWVVCPNCGKNLTAGKCSCGQSLHKGWIVCPACARPLTSRREPHIDRSAVSEEEVFEWLIHDDDGPNMDSDDAVDVAEAISSSYSAQQFAGLKSTFAWLHGPGYDEEEALDHARLVAEGLDEITIGVVQLLFEWLVGEDGPEMDRDEAFCKAMEMVNSGLNESKKVEKLKLKFEWAHSSERGPEWDSEQALDWAESKVIG